jgi:hypothetical protein
MDRVLLVGGAMLLVGLALAGVFVIVSFYGASFETFEDHVVGWLNKI